MFLITQEQMDVFSENGRRNYENRMVKHVERVFPKEYQAMSKQGDEAPVRELIRRTIERGEAYQIRSEQAVAGLLNLSILYGEEFELQPDMDWAKEILEDQSLEEITRINLVTADLPE